MDNRPRFTACSGIFNLQDFRSVIEAQLASTGSNLYHARELRVILTALAGQIIEVCPNIHRPGDPPE